MLNVLKDFKKEAASDLQRIVYAEGNDERIIKAAAEIEAEKIAEIIILGNRDSIMASAEEYETDLKGVEIIDPEKSAYTEEISEKFYQLRKHKEISREEAAEIVKDPLYFGTMMIKTGKAAGMVAGAANATGKILRPAFQIIKTVEGISTVSSAIILVLKDKSFGENGVMVFSDCAVNPTPNSEQLAEIAMITADTAKRLLNLDPKVAMLSFSTKGSASHENVDNVAEAVKIVRETAPQLKIDGEMQADAALVESVGHRKAPGSKIAGKANILIFPDLQSANIGYKLVQRLAGAEAAGPVLQGLAAPINDLSRGCSVEDVINLTAITAVQAQNN